jgi:hypothetical protein
VSDALEKYRDAFRAVSADVVEEVRTARRQRTPPVTPDGLAAVAVSLVHGCALQALIEPKTFRVDRHFDTAAKMLGRVGMNGDAR